MVMFVQNCSIETRSLTNYDHIKFCVKLILLDHLHDMCCNNILYECVRFVVAAVKLHFLGFVAIRASAIHRMMICMHTWVSLSLS